MSTEVDDSEIDVIKASDVKIFPYRILKPKTAEKILNDIFELDGILRVLINGENLPQVVNMGPAKGEPVNHTDRTTININGNEVPLSVSVGEIILTVQLDNLDDFVSQVNDILDKHIDFGFSVSTGIFTKTTTSVSDYMKYGEGFEGRVDSRLIGLVDPSAKSSESVRYIR